MGNCIQAPVHAAVVTDDSSLKRNTTGHEVDEEDFDSVTSSRSGFAASPSFVYSKNTCALEHYDPVRLLGEGSISTVHLVRCRKQRVTIPYKERATVMARANKTESPATQGSEQQDVAEDWSRGDLYAVKTIRCRHIRNNKIVQEMKDEIFTTSRLHHPNIVHVVEGFERKRHIYMVMECCRGGDLLQVEGTTEQHAKAIVRHVLLAVSYMHNKGVVHRDLKLENVLFATPSHKASEVKVIDYGLATNYLANVDKNMTERVGSIYTMAPEVLRGDYDHKCDLWSLGVVAYCLLSGTKPFWGPNVHIPWTERRAIMIDRILRGDYVDMEGCSWDHVSDEAKAFVKSLLQLDPQQRPSAAEALESPWMQTKSDMDIENLSLMNHEQKEQRAQRLAVLLVMEKASSDDILTLQRILHRYDPEETGFIALSDLRKALNETGRFEPSELDELVPEMKKSDIQYRVDHADFISKALEKRVAMETERVIAALDKLDANQNGKISLQKLRDHLGQVLPIEYNSLGETGSLDWISELLGNVGDVDGEVEMQEVLKWFGLKRLES